jgi:hypothetical protein
MMTKHSLQRPLFSLTANSLSENKELPSDASPLKGEIKNNTLFKHFRRNSIIKLSNFVCFFIAALWLMTATLAAQDTVTGAFEGTVTDRQSGTPLGRAQVTITNEQTNFSVSLTTDTKGRFFQGKLLPGSYLIRVELAGFQTRELRRELRISRTGEVVPVPIRPMPN